MSSANVEPTPVNNRVAADGNSARTALPTMGMFDRVEAWLSRVSEQLGAQGLRIDLASVRVSIGSDDEARG